MDDALQKFRTSIENKEYAIADSILKSVNFNIGRNTGPWAGRIGPKIDPWVDYFNQLDLDQLPEVSRNLLILNLGNALYYTTCRKKHFKVFLNLGNADLDFIHKNTAWRRAHAIAVLYGIADEKTDVLLKFLDSETNPTLCLLLANIFVNGLFSFENLSTMASWEFEEHLTGTPILVDERDKIERLQCDHINAVRLITGLNASSRTINLLLECYFCWTNLDSVHDFANSNFENGNLSCEQAILSFFMLACNKDFSSILSEKPGSRSYKFAVDVMGFIPGVFGNFESFLHDKSETEIDPHLRKVFQKSFGSSDPMALAYILSFGIGGFNYKYISQTDPSIIAEITNTRFLEKIVTQMYTIWSNDPSASASDREFYLNSIATIKNYLESYELRLAQRDIADSEYGENQ